MLGLHLGVGAHAHLVEGLPALLRVVLDDRPHELVDHAGNITDLSQEGGAARSPRVQGQVGAQHPHEQAG